MNLAPIQVRWPCCENRSELEAWCFRTHLAHVDVSCRQLGSTWNARFYGSIVSAASHARMVVPKPRRRGVDELAEPVPSPTHKFSVAMNRREVVHDPMLKPFELTASSRASELQPTDTMRI